MDWLAAGAPDRAVQGGTTHPQTLRNVGIRLATGKTAHGLVCLLVCQSPRSAAARRPHGRERGAAEVNRDQPNGVENDPARCGRQGAVRLPSLDTLEPRRPQERLDAALGLTQHIQHQPHRTCDPCRVPPHHPRDGVAVESRLRERSCRSDLLLQIQPMAHGTRAQSQKSQKV